MNVCSVVNIIRTAEKFKEFFNLLSKFIFVLCCSLCHVYNTATSHSSSNRNYIYSYKQYTTLCTYVHTYNIVDCINWTIIISLSLVLLLFLVDFIGFDQADCVLSIWILLLFVILLKTITIPSKNITGLQNKHLHIHTHTHIDRHFLTVLAAHFLLFLLF